MADNTTLNVGTGGDVIATDDVGGVKYQLVQLVTGADSAAKTLVTAGQTTMAASVPTALASDQTPFTDRTGSGSIAAATQSVEITLGGCGSLGIHLDGTWVGSMELHGSVDGLDWEQIAFTSPLNGAVSSLIAGNDNMVAPCAGFARCRIYATAWTSGTANIVMRATAGAASTITLGSNLPAGQNLIGFISQGQGGGFWATPWWVSGQVADQDADNTDGPVRVGGKYNATQPTYTDLDRADAQMSPRGALRVVQGVEGFAAGRTATKADLAASAPATAAVGIASAAVLAANASRTGAVLINTSTTGQRISLGLDGAAAVLDSGLTLWPGDAWIMDDYTYTAGAIAGIASAASAACAVQEFA